jgi:hypothetical protein
MQRRVNFMPVCVTQGETRAYQSLLSCMEIIKLLQTMQQLGAALCSCASCFKGFGARVMHKWLPPPAKTKFASASLRCRSKL